MGLRPNRRAAAAGLCSGSGYVDMVDRLAGQNVDDDIVDRLGGARQDGSHAVAARRYVVGVAEDAPDVARRNPSDDYYVSLLLGAIPMGVRLVVSAEQAQIGFHAGLAAVALFRRARAGRGPHIHIVEPVGQSGLSPLRAAQLVGATWISQRRRV